MLNPNLPLSPRYLLFPLCHGRNPLSTPMAILLSFSPHPPKPTTTHNPISHPQLPLSPISKTLSSPSRREFLFETVTLSITSLTLQNAPVAFSAPESSSPPSKSILSAIANTKSWFQFYGDGFAIRIPPQFEDITEPEDFNAGATLYGDKAKTKTFAARFASPDGSEVVSVIIKPSNQLKITFLEAQDITDLGSLKQAAKIFVPGGATIYTARTIKIKEEEGYRTYYFYEFGRDEQHVALVAAINGGRTFVAGASAPESSWDSDGVKLRSAAISMTVL